MRFILAILASTIVTGCSFYHRPVAIPPDEAAVVDQYKLVRFEGEVASDAERAACAEAGGSISREGMLGWEHCVQTYPDAGQTCTGDADCLGTCRYEGDASQPGARVSGTCQVRDVPFGCYATVEGGRLQHALCVD